MGLGPSGIIFSGVRLGVFSKAPSVRAALGDVSVEGYGPNYPRPQTPQPQTSDRVERGAPPLPPKQNKKQQNKDQVRFA